MPSFATPPPDPATIKSEARARHILIEALKRSDIPEQKLSLDYYQPVYWHSPKIGDSEVIVVSITTHTFGSGYTTLLLYPESLALRTVEARSDDEEATDALADALSYIKFTASQLLGHTQQLLSLRGVNEYCKRYADEYGDALRDGYALLGEPIRRGFEKARKDMENRLALESIAKRGGSDPKLKNSELEVLHVQYDGLRKVGRKIKTDYNKALKRFSRARASRGYTHKQWRTHWQTYCADNYPEEIRDFAMLFTHPDAPSASAVAYQKLAETTGHKLSYLPGLVTKSRKLKKQQQ